MVRDLYHRLIVDHHAVRLELARRDLPVGFSGFVTPRPVEILVLYVFIGPLEIIVRLHIMQFLHCLSVNPRACCDGMSLSAFVNRLSVP